MSKDIDPTVAQEEKIREKMIEIALMATMEAIKAEKKENERNNGRKENVPAGERAMQNSISPTHFL